MNRSKELNQCPGCEEIDETLEHMLRCPNAHMVTARTNAIKNVRAKGITQGIPKPFMTCVTLYLQRALNGIEETYPREIQTVFESQDRIGKMMFVRGFISVAWTRLGHSMDVANINQKISKLIRLLWEELVGHLWTTRNNILHGSTNYVTESTHVQLGDRLLWYLQHKDELSRRDQDLIRFTPAQVDAMSILQRQEWVRHLDITRAAWTKERAILATGHRLITQYFPRTSTG